MSPANARSMIFHWKGTSWSRVTSPHPGTYDQLHAVTATSANNVWAAGYFYKTNSATCGPLFVHWNGSAWSEVPNRFDATCDNIFGIDAVAANNIWALGYDATSGMGTLILRWDGKAWGKVSSPSPGKTYNILTGVSAVSAANAWAAGYYCKSGCTSGTPAYAPLILHWNGTAWSH